jgi:predicted ATP-dependent serine protease
LIIGYEMSALQIFMRDVSREGKIPVTHVMGREPFEGMEVQDTTKSISRMMEEWDCHYIDSPYITLASVAAHARTLHRQKPLDFIIVDYLQIIPRGNHGKRRSDEILVELSTDLSRLQKELGCTLIAPLQVNADGEIAEAKAIVNPAQVYLRIEMIEKDNEETGAKEGTDEGFLRVLKNRFGAVNRACPVFRNGCYQTFEDREHTHTPEPRTMRKTREYHR